MVKEVIHDYKIKKIGEFARFIRDNKIANGVEMESYILAKNFPNKLGVYMEVSDNVIKAEKVSFDMEKFYKNVNKHFLPVIEKFLKKV